MMKILIADDEAYEREILAEIIDRGFSGEVQVRMAENGRQALDMATLWEADIALMDIEMPGLNGLEAAKQILAQQPESKILFITAYSLFTYAHEAVKLGAFDYILKPVDAADVQQAVGRAIHQVEAQRQLKGMAPAAKLLETTPSMDKTSQLMGKVKEYLQHNYMICDISLDSVSAILGINPSYFSQLFKRALGVNFVDYLTDVRMQAAKELLRDPMRSTSEVASMVGYESANYFARAFKRKVGMTPTDYRRLSRSQKGGIL